MMNIDKIAKEPLVSIIIPVYNGDARIIDTLNSVKNQTYNNYEVIIVNDGSTDLTGSLIADYSIRNNNFKVINKLNGGVSSARNKGIRHSRGKYICFLDADDKIAGNYISVLVKKSEDHESELVYCGYKDVKELETNNVTNKFTLVNVLDKYLIGSLKLQTSCFFIKRDILVKYSIFFDETISWGEDIHFFTNVLSKVRKIQFVDEYLVFYHNFDSGSIRLSTFKTSLIDKDFSYNNAILSDDRIQLSEKQRRIISNYRIPAQLIYKLRKLLDYDQMEFIKYYKEYNHVINRKIDMVAGLRSLKLLICRKMIKIEMRKINGK